MEDESNSIDNSIVNPFTYGLNYSMINSHDYSEDVEDIDSTIERNPLVSSILHKLKQRYKKLVKKEKMDEIIKDDFFNFLNNEDELLSSLNDLVYTEETNTFFEEFLDVRTDIIDNLGEDMELQYHLNLLENKEKNKILKESIKKIEEDTNIDFDKLIIKIAKLKLYQNKLSQEYLNLRKEIKKRLEIIEKKIKGLKSIEKIFDFDEEDTNQLKEIIDKYIKKEDIFELINKYIPVKIKLYLLISINDSYKNGYDCRVCLSQQNQLYAIAKCGHVFCETCINSIDRCPLCRLPIDRTIRLYL